jgi:CubicO group peptidase (beta-lactamase class C family)
MEIILIQELHHPSKYLPLFIVFILLATACSHWSPRVNRYGLPERGYTYQQPEAIDDGWDTAFLKDVGIDSEKISDMMRDILGGNDKNIHSILLIKNGKLVFEEYFYGYRRDKLHFLASVSKSITSILIGISIDQKVTADVETKVYAFFPEYAGTRWIEQKYPITLQHILAMAAGVEWNAMKYSRRDPRHTTHQMYASGNPIQFVLQRELIETPGEKFYYNSGLTILLGGIVRNTSGLYIDEFAEQYLFTPLGISDYHWDKFSDGNIQTDGGLHLRPRDMAKIGYMILKNGKWKDRQIVSKQWIAESTKRRVNALGVGYGYQWWIGQTTMNAKKITVLFASGHGGQKIFIVPQLDLVAVFTSRVFNSKGHSAPEGFLLKYIIPSIVQPVSPLKAIQLPPQTLDKFIGKYKSDELDAVIAVFRKGDKLYSQTSFWDKFELIPQNETQFFGDSKNVGKFHAHFVTDAFGEVKHFKVYFGFRGLQFDKIE